jgi:hypothetical protein
LTQQSNININNYDSISDTPNWLDEWNYRIEHSILGAIGAGFNYQIQLDVHYGEGVSNGKDVYCNEFCQRDFDDIRFTESDGVTLLSYWREEFTLEDIATFWVKINEDLENNITIYMYFGNRDAVSVSSGDETFIFFDDFESGTFEKWTISQMNWEITNDKVRNGEYSALGRSGYVEERELEKSISLESNFMVHMWIRVSTARSIFYFGMNRDQSGTWVYSTVPRHNTTQHYNGIEWAEWPNNNEISSFVWYRIEYAINIEDQIQHAWKNRNSMGTIPLLNENNNPVLSISALGAVTYWVEGRRGWMDDYYVRKWVESEPQQGIWSDIQTTLSLSTNPTLATSTSYPESTTMTNETKSTTNTGVIYELWSIVSIIITIGSTIVIIVFVILIFKNR